MSGFFAGFVNGLFNGMDWREQRQDRAIERERNEERWDWAQEDRTWEQEDRQYTLSERQRVQRERQRAAGTRARNEEDARRIRERREALAVSLFGGGAPASSGGGQAEAPTTAPAAAPAPLLPEQTRWSDSNGASGPRSPARPAARFSASSNKDGDDLKAQDIRRNAEAAGAGPAQSRAVSVAPRLEDNEPIPSAMSLSRDAERRRLNVPTADNEPIPSAESIRRDVRREGGTVRDYWDALSPEQRASYSRGSLPTADEAAARQEVAQQMPHAVNPSYVDPGDTSGQVRQFAARRPISIAPTAPAGSFADAPGDEPSPGASARIAPIERVDGPAIGEIEVALRDQPRPELPDQWALIADRSARARPAGTSGDASRAAGPAPAAAGAGQPDAADQRAQGISTGVSDFLGRVRDGAVTLLNGAGELAGGTMLRDAAHDAEVAGVVTSAVGATEFGADRFRAADDLRRTAARPGQTQGAPLASVTLPQDIAAPAQAGAGARPQSPAPAPAPASAAGGNRARVAPAPAPVRAASRAPDAPRIQIDAQRPTQGRGGRDLGNLTPPPAVSIMPGSGAAQAPQTATASLPSGQIVAQVSAASGQQPGSSRPQTPEATGAAIGQFRTRYRREAIEPLLQEYVRQGRLDAAQDLMDFFDSMEGRRGLETWAAGMFAYANNDVEGMLDALAETYNNEGYFPDGLSVDRQRTSIRRNESGEVIGADITFIDNATGSAVQRRIDGVEDMFAQAIGALSPEAAFEHYQAGIAARRESRASRTLSPSDLREIREQAFTELTEGAPIGSPAPTSQQVDERMRDIIGSMGLSASGIGGRQVPVMY